MTILVLGAGEIGRRLVQRLVAAGDEVVVATRSGTQLPGARSVAVDASSPEHLAAVTRTASTVVVATNPSQYHRWPELWPPLIDSVIAASEGKHVVLMGNLYAYGRADMPMTERSPFEPAEVKGRVRAAVWEKLLLAHLDGRLRAVEVRASDYIGPGAGATSQLGARFFEPVLAGNTAWVVGDPAAAHSWSYLDDIAATLNAAIGYSGEWGRAWHVPSTEHSRTAIADEVDAVTGRRSRVVGYPAWVLAGLGLVSPFLRAVGDSSYQFTAPFLIDASETERELGVAATPWTVVLRETLAGYR